MRTRITLLAASIMIAVAASAFGDGGVFFTYHNDEASDAGYGVGAKFEWPLTQQLSIDARIAYITGFDWEDLSILPIEANANWNIPLYGYTPYLGAGLAYYYYDPSDIDPEIGINIHGGVKLDVSMSGYLFGEVKYTELHSSSWDGNATSLSLGYSWRF